MSLKNEMQKWKRKKEKGIDENNLEQIYNACSELASVYFNNDNYDDALSEYKEMARISEVLNNKMNEARANRMIGEVYCYKGDFREALKHQLIHLKISQNKNDKIEQQRALATIGRTNLLHAESYVDKNNDKILALEEARSYLLQSLSICDMLGDGEISHNQLMEMKGRLYLNLGIVYDYQDLNEESIDYLNRANLIFKSNDNYEDYYKTLLNLGSVYQRTKDVNHSLQCYDQALLIAERLNKKFQYFVEILPLKATVLLEMPDFRSARQALLKAFKICKNKLMNNEFQKEIERKLRIVAAMYENEEKLIKLTSSEDWNEKKLLYEKLGDMASTLRNFAVAITYYNLTLECVEKLGENGKTLLDCYVSLAQTHKDNKDYRMAMKYFKKELEFEIKIDINEAAKTCLNIADLHGKLGEIDNMNDVYRKAKVFSKNNPVLKKEVLTTIYVAFTETKQFELARKLKERYGDLLLDNNCDELEENEILQEEYGADICLSDLTDDEPQSDNEEIVRKKPISRSRTKKNIDKRNEKGETPLHTATIAGNISLVTKLLDQGHCIDVMDYCGWTPLHEACNHGHLNIAKLLIDSGAQINHRGGPHCDGLTPLLDACTNGNLDVIDLLLENNASALMRTNKGESVVNCLTAWRERYIEDTGHDLEGSHLNHYNKVLENFKQILKNAGQKMSINSSKTINSDKSVQRISRFKKKSSEENISSTTSDFKKSLRGEIDDISSSRLKRKSFDSAADEYQSAINILRHGKKTDKLNNIEKKEINCLLKENEIVGDDWLDVDVEIKEKKKRRFEDFVGEPLRKTKICKFQPVSPLKLNYFDRKSRSLDFDEDSNSNDNTPNQINNEFYCNYVVKNENNDSTNFNEKLNKIKQSFNKKQKSVTSIEIPQEKELKFTEKNVETNMPKSFTSDIILPVVNIKLKVEEQLLLIPIMKSKIDSTIGWLAKEAATRYYNLEGIEPNLRIKTEDGAILMDSDPISTVLSAQNLVGAVLSWKIESPNKRYSNICESMNIESKDFLSKLLEDCTSSYRFSIQNLYLRNNDFTAVLKSLIHCHPLQILDLSGNNFLNVGIQTFIECLKKLSNLQNLNLSNCGITADMLSELADGVENSKLLQRLRKLNLSYNSLHRSMVFLTKLLNAVPPLSELNLESADFLESDFRCINFSLDCIEKLNLSDNQICADGLRLLLGIINPKSLQELNLTRIGDGTISEIAVWLEYHSMDSLIILRLSYNNPTEEETVKLTNCLRLIPNLEMFEYFNQTDLEIDIVESLLSSQIKEISFGISNNLNKNYFSTTSKRKIQTLCRDKSMNIPGIRLGPFGYSEFSNQCYDNN